MKVNAKGRVAMKFDVNHNIYKAGTVAGFPPSVAKKLKDAGIASEYDPGGKPVMAEAPAVKQLLVALADGTLEIPSNWRDEHHMARINWAKKISPDTADINSGKANEIIAEAVKDQE